MKHFLCTRFNLKNEDWKTDRDDVNVLSEEWMKQRLELFEKYCLPSVLNQKNKNFTWVIFFDLDTSAVYRNRIEMYSNNGINFSAVYIDGTASLVDELKKFVYENISEHDEFIITSRLDNDDAIHQNFIDVIQELAKDKHEMVIDLITGYQMNISNNIYEFRNHFKYFNPFISVVESSKNIKSVYSKQHFEWNESDSIKSYNLNPLWIEIIHSKNKLNIIRKNSFLITNIKLEEFGIERELSNLNLKSIIINNFYLTIKKSFRKFKFNRRINFLSSVGL